MRRPQLGNILENYVGYNATLQSPESDAKRKKQHNKQRNMLVAGVYNKSHPLIAVIGEASTGISMYARG